MNKTEPPITKDYLTIVALEDGLTAKLSVNACEYCVNGNGIWKTLSADIETETINAGQTLSFRGNLIPNSTNGIGTFTVNRYFNLKGNCMSMLYGDDAKIIFSLAGKNYAFYKLFANNTMLVDTSELVLQAITLEKDCYHQMFYNCVTLVIAPVLPATTLAYNCYREMFNKCTNLITAPELLATKLATCCYYGMFMNCTNLAMAPELPAEVLESYCYQSMFQNCTNLIVAPCLNATTLAVFCYCEMFKGCCDLNYIKALFITTPNSSYTNNWLEGVASNGIFVKSKAAAWDVVGNSGVPEGWTVISEY